MDSQRGGALAVVRPSNARASMAQVRASSIGELKDISLAFARSGFFEDAKDAAQVFTKMMAGSEWGLGPMAAMSGIFIVKNKPTMSATTIAGVIKKSGVYDFRRDWLTRKADGKLAVVADELNDVVVGCRVSFYQSGDHLGDSVFTDTDAAKAGLTSNPTYQKFPRNMYFSRALTNGARWHCPDVFGGAIYTPDEMDEQMAMDANLQPVGYVDPNPNQTALPMPAEAARKPKTLAEIKSMFEQALPVLPQPANGEPLKLGVWLEASGIAPELSARVDAVTGRKLGLTADEAIAAEDALLAAHAKIKATFAGDAGSVVDEEIPETVYDDASFPADAPPSDGISDAARKRIMALFNERKGALARMFPVAKNADERRHLFAVSVLGEESKGSSKTWTVLEYKRVSDKLEAIQPDSAE